MKPAFICALALVFFASLPTVAQQDRPSPWATPQSESGSSSGNGNGPSPFKVNPEPSGNIPPVGGTTPPIGTDPSFGGGKTPPFGTNPTTGGTTPGKSPEWRPTYGGTAPLVQPTPSGTPLVPSPTDDHSWYKEQFEGKEEPGTGRIYGSEPGTFIEPPKKQVPEAAPQSNSSPVNLSFDTIVNYAIIAIGLFLGFRYITKKKAPQNTDAKKETV